MTSKAQKITAKLKDYPTLAACGLVSVALGVALFFRYDLRDSQQAELERVSAESARYRENIANSAQLQDQLSFLTEANKAVKAKALTVDGIAQNLQYFYRLESEVGIKYLDLRAGARAATPAKSTVYVPINYIVSIEGSFAQIITFLRHLEQGAYFCRINTAVAAGNGANVVLNLNVDLLGVP